MKLAIKNLGLIAALLLAGGKGAVAGECTGLQCFEPLGPDRPRDQTRPFCYGDGMLEIRENNGGVVSYICYCIDGWCDVFRSRCTGRGWVPSLVGGCSCDRVKECFN